MQFGHCTERIGHSNTYKDWDHEDVIYASEISPNESRVLTYSGTSLAQRFIPGIQNVFISMTKAGVQTSAVATGKY